MKMIETCIYEPIPDKPGYVRNVGARKAKEVFEELEKALQEANLLPNEYFLLDTEFDNEKALFPEMVDVIAYANWGSSEGIYLDVYVFGYDGQHDKTKRFHFATGKTLSEDSDSFDRMQYIAGYIYKLFMGFHQTPARYRLISNGNEELQTKVMNRVKQEYMNYLRTTFVHKFEDPQKVGAEVSIRSMIVSELPNCLLPEDKLKELDESQNALELLTKICRHVIKADEFEINDSISSCRTFLSEEGGCDD